MDRRSFLVALSGAAGAAVMTSFLPREASAAPLGAVKDAAPGDAEVANDVAEAAGTAPDGTSVESVGWRRRRYHRRRWRARRRYRNRRRYWNRRRYYRRGRRCRTRWDALGRKYVRCW